MIDDRDGPRVEDHDGVEDGSVVVDLKAKPEAVEKPADAKTIDKGEEDGADRNVDVAKLQARLKDIEANAERNRKAREQAEADKVKAQTETHYVKSNLLTSEFHTVANALAAEEARASALENALADASAAGRHADIAKIQREMSRTEAKILALENGKAQIANSIKTRPAEPDIKPTPVEHDDPAERMIAQVTNPKTQQFLRDRKDWLSNPKTHAKMLGLHHMAVADGYTPDTQDYLDYIDQNMTDRRASGRSDDNDPRREAPRDHRRAIPAAPVSRDSGGELTSSQVRLSAEERDIARAQGYTDGEWAKLKVQANKLKAKDGIVRFSRDQFH